MNNNDTTPDTSATARKALGLAHAAITKRIEQARHLCEFTRNIAESNKTPTGKWKRSHKDAVSQANEVLMKAKSELHELKKTITRTAYELRASDKALTARRRSERLTALIIGLGLSAENETSGDWSKARDLWIANREANSKDTSGLENPFKSGERLAFNLAQNGEVFTMSPETYNKIGETAAVEVQMHLLISFNDLGEVDDAKIYCGLPNDGNRFDGSNFLNHSIGFYLDCLGWNMNFILSSFNGSPLCVSTYAKGLAFAVKVNAALRQFPQVKFFESIDTDSLAAEWASL